VQSTLQSLTDAATSHVNLYPPYQSVSTQRLSVIIGTYGGLVLLIAFATYLVVLWGMLRAKVLGKESMTQRIVVATCLLIIVLFVLETIVTKAAMRSTHDQSVVTDNGTMLVGATVLVNSQFGALCTAVGKGVALPQILGAYGQPPPAPAPATTQRSAAAALLSDCRGVVEKFDMCNAITVAQKGAPPPVPELIVYGAVAATFLVFAAIAVHNIGPLERLHGIQAINVLTDRVMRGDKAALAEARSIAECSRPSPDIWRMFVWFAVMIFVILTGWFAAVAYTGIDQYGSSLDSREDCA